MNSYLSRLPNLPVEHDPNTIVRAFAANSAFRAAERHELSTEHDPLRRPVRPDDLKWLDFATPMFTADAVKLTALLGHRMLRNAYDSGLLYLPATADAGAMSDFESVYSTDNRVLSAWAKPILERHLFTLLDEEVELIPELDSRDLTAHILDYHHQRSTDPGTALHAAGAAVNRVEAATFVLLQYTAFAPASYSAIAHGAIGEYQNAHPTLRQILLDTYRHWTGSARAYQQLLARAGLSSTTGAYWQLYLSSSLGRGNYLHHLASNRDQLCRFIGAYLHLIIDEHVNRNIYYDLFAEAFDAPPEYFQPVPRLSEESTIEVIGSLIGPLVEIFGPAAIAHIHHGFSGAAWLEQLWNRDLDDQLTWADRLDEYKDKADKLAHYIDTEGIAVDLDTFVESCEETSTTHVHDDHRLVMIEKGQMHFWNNITHKIGLETGDRILIPATRLHGSTVLSGECTYHQPIIPDDMLHKIC